jgi:molybdopterin molybdotransferase
LVPVGTQPGPDQIVASSVYSVRAACAAAGAAVVDLGLTRDDLSSIRERIRAAKAIPADVLVTLGGASVGEHDLVKQAFAAEGLDFGFWKIAMRPGKPLVFGRLGPMRVLGLPGNPVASYACTVLFLVPLVRALSGLPPGPEIVPAVLGCDVAANGIREDYLRAQLKRDADGTIIATPFEVQDSSMQAILAAADGLLLREPHAPAAARGSACRVLPF